MSGTMLPIYRLPTPTAVQLGQIRVVTDRHNRRYINGSQVLTATPSGDFHILTLANGAVYYVKTQDYIDVPDFRHRRRRS